MLLPLITKKIYDCNYSEFVLSVLLIDGYIESNQKPKTKTKKPIFFMLPLKSQ